MQDVFHAREIFVEIGPRFVEHFAPVGFAQRGKLHDRMRGIEEFVPPKVAASSCPAERAWQRGIRKRRRAPRRRGAAAPNTPAPRSPANSSSFSSGNMPSDVKSGPALNRRSRPPVHGSRSAMKPGSYMRREHAVYTGWRMCGCTIDRRADDRHRFEIVLMIGDDERGAAAARDSAEAAHAIGRCDPKFDC